MPFIIEPVDLTILSCHLHCHSGATSRKALARRMTRCADDAAMWHSGPVLFRISAPDVLCVHDLNCAAVSPVASFLCVPARYSLRLVDYSNSTLDTLKGTPALQHSDPLLKEDIYSAYEAARVGGINFFDTAEARNF